MTALPVDLLLEGHSLLLEVLGALAAAEEVDDVAAHGERHLPGVRARRVCAERDSRQNEACAAPIRKRV